VAARRSGVDGQMIHERLVAGHGFTGQRIQMF
jgi:hypothetical protein